MLPLITGMILSQHGERQIDIRHYLIALSTIHRPSKSMETLKLAFKVSTFTHHGSGLVPLCQVMVLKLDVVVQMYESEENGQVLEEELATILGIMLGVKEVDLSRLFLALGKPDSGKIVYGKTHCLFDHQ